MIHEDCTTLPSDSSTLLSIIDTVIRSFTIQRFCFKDNYDCIALYIIDFVKTQLSMELPFETVSAPFRVLLDRPETMKGISGSFMIANNFKRVSGN